MDQQKELCVELSVERAIWCHLVLFLQFSSDLQVCFKQNFENHCLNYVIIGGSKGALGTSTRSNFFHFQAVFGKISCQILCFCPKLRAWIPRSRKSWIRHCYFSCEGIAHVVCKSNRVKSIYQSCTTSFHLLVLTFL